MIASFRVHIDSLRNIRAPILNHDVIFEYFFSSCSSSFFFVLLCFSFSAFLLLFSILVSRSCHPNDIHDSRWASVQFTSIDLTTIEILCHYFVFVLFILFRLTGNQLISVLWRRRKRNTKNEIKSQNRYSDCLYDSFGQNLFFFDTRDDNELRCFFLFFFTWFFVASKIKSQKMRSSQIDAHTRWKKKIDEDNFIWIAIFVGFFSSITCRFRFNFFSFAGFDPFSSDKLKLFEKIFTRIKRAQTANGK